MRANFESPVAGSRRAMTRTLRDRSSAETASYSPTQPTIFARDRREDPSSDAAVLAASFGERFMSASRRSSPAGAPEGLGAAPVISADGTPELWTGRCSVTMDSASEFDPLVAMAPVRTLGALYAVADITLPLGTPVRDYLAEAQVAEQPAFT